MALSRRFHALLRLSALWAVPWATLGLVLGAGRWAFSPALRQGPGTLLGWLVNHVATYGALGLISGLSLGLLLARAAQDASLPVSRSRLVRLAAGAGVLPVLLFAGLGLAFGAPLPAMLSLPLLALLSAGGSAALGAVAHGIMARALSGDPDPTSLPGRPPGQPGA